MTINRNLSILAGGVSNTGVLSVPYGGTGNVSMTVGYIPYGNGTSAFSSSANFTYNGTVLSINSGSSQVPLALSNNNSNALTASFTNTNNNAVLSIGVGGSGGFGITNWANSILIEGSPAGAGGTLIGSYTGPIYFQVNGRTVQAMQIAPSGGVSIGNTTDPGAGNLSVTGSLNLGTALSVANGGTGLSTLTAGYIPYGNGAGAFNSSANLFWDNTNSRLSLQKGASPSYNIDILSATPTIRLATPSAAADNATILFEIANNFSGISQAYIKGIGPGNSGVSQLAFGVGITSGATTATEVARFDTGGNFRPSADNAYSNGTAALRWSVIYSATALINTSDATQKQQVRKLNDAEKQAALGIKQALKTFKFNDSVAEKGDKARIHIGVLAQEVREIFSVVGLDANDYGLFCSDTWYVNDKQEVFKTNLDVDGKAINTLTPVTRLGVRYEELLAFVIAAL